MAPAAVILIILAGFWSADWWADHAATRRNMRLLAVSRAVRLSRGRR